MSFLDSTLCLPRVKNGVFQLVLVYKMTTFKSNDPTIPQKRTLIFQTRKSLCVYFFVCLQLVSASLMTFYNSTHWFIFLKWQFFLVQTVNASCHQQQEKLLNTAWILMQTKLSVPCQNKFQECFLQAHGDTFPYLDNVKNNQGCSRTWELLQMSDNLNNFNQLFSVKKQNDLFSFKNQKYILRSDMI